VQAGSTLPFVLAQGNAYSNTQNPSLEELLSTSTMIAGLPRRLLSQAAAPSLADPGLQHMGGFTSSLYDRTSLETTYRVFSSQLSSLTGVADQGQSTGVERGTNAAPANLADGLAPQHEPFDRASQESYRPPEGSPFN
jgi:hypothetical protein